MTENSCAIGVYVTVGFEKIEINKKIGQAVNTVAGRTCAKE